MVVAACRIEDISDTPNPKTNEWLNEAKRLLRVTLEQQAESLASRFHAVLSLLSQTTVTANVEGGGGCSDAHTPQAVRSSGDTSGNSFD
jgi:hypothetical protein